MKATGIVRRIDELGRVVIPKEIRRTQRIRQGDALEIFTAADGQVVFKKYSPLVELGELAGVYAEVLAKNLGRRQETARELGISMSTLWRKIKKYHIGA